MLSTWFQAFLTSYESINTRGDSPASLAGGGGRVEGSGDSNGWQRLPGRREAMGVRSGGSLLWLGEVNPGRFSREFLGGLGASLNVGYEFCQFCLPILHCQSIWSLFLCFWPFVLPWNKRFSLVGGLFGGGVGGGVLSLLKSLWWTLLSGQINNLAMPIQQWGNAKLAQVQGASLGAPRHLRVLSQYLSRGKLNAISLAFQKSNLPPTIGCHYINDQVNIGLGL